MSNLTTDIHPAILAMRKVVRLTIPLTNSVGQLLPVTLKVDEGIVSTYPTLNFAWFVGQKASKLLRLAKLPATTAAQDLVRITGLSVLLSTTTTVGTVSTVVGPVLYWWDGSSLTKEPDLASLGKIYSAAKSKL